MTHIIMGIMGYKPCAMQLVLDVVGKKGTEVAMFNMIVDLERIDSTTGGKVWLSHHD